MVQGPFSLVVSNVKKDTRDIVSLLSPVNNIIIKLKGGILVGFEGQNRQDIKCMYLPNIATKFVSNVDDNVVVFEWSGRPAGHERKLDELDAKDQHKIWKIIENFTYFVTGYLAFYATILGCEL